jgi:hypothetical protein
LTSTAAVQAVLSKEEETLKNSKDTSTNETKPAGNTDPDVPNSPDVKNEGWSAEEVAEQSAYKDGTEVKQEIKRGKEVQRKNR